MGLNARATQEDEMGQLYLTNVDFLKNGVPASVIAALVRPFIAIILDMQHTNWIALLGGRIAWLCADEGCRVCIFFPLPLPWPRSCPYLHIE